MGSTCCSSCSLLLMDKGASNSFSSVSAPNITLVFVTAPARGSRKTYFLYLQRWKECRAAYHQLEAQGPDPAFLFHPGQLVYIVDADTSKGQSDCWGPHKARPGHPATLPGPRCVPYRFSVVLNSSKELTELMLLGRPPSPSSASSSGSGLVFTHTGKYFSFSWQGQ